MNPTAKRFSLAEEEVDGAARDLSKAVEDYLRRTKTGKGRRTSAGFVGVVRTSLKRERCSKDLFRLVVDRAVEMRLLARRPTESGRTYLVPLREQEDEKDERDEELRAPAGRDSTVVSLPAPSAEGRPPVDGYPEDHRCGKCGSQSTLCASCNEPAWEDDLYVDSKGRWRCSGCNDLHFTESWGGVNRWRRPTQPKPEVQKELLELDGGEE